MKLALILLVLLIAGYFLINRFTGFHTQTPEQYAESKPQFDLMRHLSGPLVSEGVLYGPRGHLVTRFVADMKGAWRNREGTLSEWFTYTETGRKQKREWNLILGEGGEFTATAADIVGTAKGMVSGATVLINYRLKLDEDAGGHVLDVTDWMYLMENGSIMNKSEMRKFGIKVAELIATIRPVQPAQ